MRICLISREYPPDTGWGGVGAYTYQMAHALAERGHDVEVIALEAAKSAAQNFAAAAWSETTSVTVHRVHWEDLLDELNLFLVCAPSTHYIVKSAIALWRKFLELHTIRPFEVVEAPEHLAAGIFQGVTGVVPLVVKLHTPHSKFVSERFHNVLPSFDNQIICLLERVTMLAADLLCSPSADLADFVARDLNFPLDQIATARNPINTEWFAPTGPKPFTNDEPTILFVGRLEERKGIRYLIAAMPAIVRQVPSAKLVVVGADTNNGVGGGSVLKELQKELAAAGLVEKVTFVPHVPLSEVANYYRAADVCVVPSLYENAPYTCIEAMSCGKAVVVTDAGGTREYVENGVSGLVVPARDSQALEQAIVRLLKDAELRQQFGARARQYVVDKCSRDVMATRMESLYREAIAVHASRRGGLYRKAASSALSDALELLCATDKAIFDVLYKESIEFRMRYWVRFLKKRPGLCLATAALWLAEKLHAEPVAARLRSAIAGKESPRYSLTMALGRQPVEHCDPLEQSKAQEPEVKADASVRL